MLSNTAETKPSASVLGHEAAGSFSTGIIDAQVTSASRKMDPLNASGSSFHCGWRSGAVARIAIHTAAPITGNASRTCGKRTFATTFATIAATRITATMNTRGQSTRCSMRASLMIGE